MPWAQGVGRSNRPAPTKAFIFSGIFERCEAARTCRRCSGPPWRAL